MKKIVSSLLALLMVISILPAGIFKVSAKVYESSYYFYFVTSDGEAIITSVDNSISGDITIPNTLGGYPVIRIEYDAFWGCNELTSVVIPDSVLGICDYAFQDCTKLSSVKLGNSVTHIGQYTFSNCSNITSINIPDSVTEIGNSAFSWCLNLASITIPDSVTEIGDGAFYGCTNLTLNIINTNIYAIEYAKANSIAYTTYHAHQYEISEIMSEPTCTETGFAEAVCTVCGEYNIIEVDALGHDYIVSTIKPTCTENGYKNSVCSRCGDTRSEKIAALGHSYESSVIEPTCTEQGYTIHTCACGDSHKTDYVDATGHIFVGVETVAPTINSQGYTIYICDICSELEHRDFTVFKVQNVVVTPNDIGFSVTWDAIDDADSYYVRIREKDGTTNLTNVNVKGTSYEFVIGKNGLSLDYDKEYTIQVIAQVSTSYQKWADADKVTSKMIVGNRVVDIKATEYKNGAQVTFRPVKNATKYWVFVRNAADDSAVYTTSTTTTSVNIINNMVGGTEYYVQIVAYADKALDSRANALKTKFVAPYVLPSTYNIAAKTPTTFSITWDAVAGADTYFVQVRDENDAPVRTVTSKNKTIAAVAMCSDGSKLSANTTYKFRIAATINGVTTGYGDWMTYTTGDYEAVTVNAEKADNKVKISWNDIPDSHAVYLYKIDANGKRTYFKYLENGETSYTIKAPASGSYSYGVITVQRNMSGDCYNPIAVSNTLTF